MDQKPNAEAEIERLKSELARLEGNYSFARSEVSRLEVELDKSRLCNADRARLEADIQARDSAIVAMALLLAPRGDR